MIDHKFSASIILQALHYLADAYSEAIFKDVLEGSAIDIREELEKRNDEGHTPLIIAVLRFGIFFNFLLN